MTDRDTFAAAALTGLLANGDYSVESIPMLAYRMADAMLRESGVTKPTPEEKRAEVSYTTHDAAPAATADSADDRTDKAAPSQRRDCTGDIPEAQIDALECVVEDGRIVGMSVYGHLRSLLVRLRPEWEDLNDPVEATGPDPDSRVFETPRTPQTHATQPQGSVPGEGSVPDSRTENEPVAWAVMADDWFHDVRLWESGAEWYASYLNNKAGKDKYRVVPLYRHSSPTLTDEEREAVKLAADFLEDEFYGCSDKCAAEHNAVATLRKMLERLA